MLVLMGLCLIGVFCSAVILYLHSYQRKQAEAAYQKISQTRKLNVKKEKVGEEAYGLPPLIDFTPFWEINPQVVAWITADDTKIDYPILQGADNNYYLRRLITGEYNVAGSIFMDYRNRKDFSDKNTVIYGHNMKDGTMFSALNHYKEQAFYDRHPFIYLNTPKANYKLKLFAGVVADGSRQSVRLDFKNADDFLDYINSLKAESTFKGSIEIKEDDYIVTLSTCSYEFNNARYIICGKLVPY